jgi:dipeptidyl aminopeptidase/acylaminoacyl peptidase
MAAIVLLPSSTLPAGAFKDKIVFVRADPTVGVQSIQQITEPNGFAPTNELGVSKDHHDAPQFQATSSRDPRKNEIGLMNPDGSGIALLHVFGTDPTLSPDGTKIAYCSLQETQYAQLFVMNLDGSGRKRITNFQNGDACAHAWSRDGKKIAFHAFALMNPPRSPGIWLMDADRSNQKKLMDRALDGAWSPDYRQIAFESNRDGGVFQIYVMNSDGSSVKPMTKTKGKLRIRRGLQMGRPLLIAQPRMDDRRGLFLIGMDASEPRRLAFSKHQDFCFPTWSLDGKFIAFTALNRVGPQAIVVGEERPRCEQWSGEYQVFTFDSDSQTHRLTEAKLAVMRVAYGKVATL